MSSRADGFVTQIAPFEANWEYVIERGLMASAMNPGLGGGPLVDRFGEVLGVVSLNLAEIGKFTLSVPSDYFLDAAPAPMPRGQVCAVPTHSIGQSSTLVECSFSSVLTVFANASVSLFSAEAAALDASFFNWAFVDCTSLSAA